MQDTLMNGFGTGASNGQAPGYKNEKNSRGGVLGVVWLYVLIWWLVQDSMKILLYKASLQSPLTAFHFTLYQKRDSLRLSELIIFTIAEQVLSYFNVLHEKKKMVTDPSSASGIKRQEAVVASAH